MLFGFIEFAHTPPVGSLPEGMGRGMLPIAEERHTVRYGANGRVFTARPCGSDHGVRLYGRLVRECVPAGNGFCPPPPGPVPLRGDSAKSGGYSSTLMRTQVRCVCLLINHLQNASGNVAESGFLLFQIPPHYPSRKNSVVNTPESKTGNVKKCAVGKHPKSEKHGNTAQFSEVERSGTQENCGGIGSGCRLRLHPLPVLRRRQSHRVACIDPDAVVVDKNIAKNDRFDLFSR